MNTLLITGVTGFLGGAALEAILNSHSGVNLLLLVRADNGEAAVARVKENLRKFNIDEEKLTRLITAAVRSALAGSQPTTETIQVVMDSKVVAEAVRKHNRSTGK